MDFENVLDGQVNHNLEKEIDSMGELIHGATIFLTVFDIPENIFLTSKFSVPGFNLGKATPLCEPYLVWQVDDVHPKSTNDLGD